MKLLPETISSFLLSTIFKQTVKKPSTMFFFQLWMLETSKKQANFFTGVN